MGTASNYQGLLAKEEIEGHKRRQEHDANIPI
jgi:hypothetical protein